MKSLLKYIAENMAAGKIDKRTAIELVTMLKAEGARNDDIAIVGISLDLPQADNLDDFWKLIRAGVDRIGPFPEARKADIDRYLNYAEPEREDLSYAVGAYLEEVDKFDYDFFRLSPKEASLMDPNQRLFLQNVWHCIEDAGYGGKKLVGTNTGVFVGFVNGFRNYAKMIHEVEPSSLMLGMTGNFSALLPSRISYLLDLRGPALLLDTACSSSMVAVDAAIQAIRNKCCDQALASGVRLQIAPLVEDDLSIGLESSDGKTRAFDNTADGAGIGEGLVTVFLKPLSKALKDKDNIYAVIKGSAVNQDGNSIGITAPNPAAQADVIAKAWENAGIDPETVSYIITHGTGTKLGDPIEIQGLTKAFRRYTTKRQFCAITSVKSNIGHLFESSGIVSLITAVLALQNKEIPPSIHFNRPNHEIPFEDSPAYVNSRLRSWEPAGMPRRVGVSSWGMSGTNAHVVLEEAPPLPVEEPTSHAPYLFLLSGKTESVLQEQVSLYQAFLTAAPNVAMDRLCYTANTGRGHYAHRLAIICNSSKELLEGLRLVGERGLANAEGLGVFYGVHRVVSGQKKDRLPSDTSEGERMARTQAAQEQMNAYVSTKQRVALNELARLYTAGADPDWEAFYAEGASRKLPLPVYPFDRKRCWIDVPAVRPVVDKAAPQEFYTVEWKHQPLPLHDSYTPEGTVLVFLGEHGLGDELAEQLRQEGRDVVEVRFGSAFRQEGDRFVVGTAEADYEHLFQALACRPIEQVLHLMTLSNGREVTSWEALQKSQQRGFESLFSLVRAMARQSFTHEIDLVLVGQQVNVVTGEEATFHPEVAPLFGMGRVVRVEHPKFNCRALDIDASFTSQMLLAEMRYGRKSLQTAYREAQRYVAMFRQKNLARVEPRKTEIRQDGVYLITGGAGGIGLEMAKWMSAQQRVRLALVGRTPLPERNEWERIVADRSDEKMTRTIEMIREMEASGSQVAFFSADVASPEQIGAAVEAIRHQFGAINGVIHAAGVAGSGYITQKDRTAVQNVINPKVYGTWMLYHLLQDEPLDFFVMFSSGAALVGEPGQGDYAAANSYLDGFAPYLSRKGIATVSINWSSWKETGMSVVFGDNVDRLFKALPTARALKLFEQVFAKNIERVFIGELDFDFPELADFLAQSPFLLSEQIQAKLDIRAVGAGRPSDELSLQNIKLTGKDSDDLYSETEKQIAAVWQNVLGFEEFHVYDNFHELGGDSVLALRIANLLNKQLGLNVNASDLLRHITIVDLGLYLDRLLSQGVQPVSLFPQLEQVEKKEYYPLSSAQKRLYVISKFSENDTSYNISKAVLLEGDLDVPRFNDALKTVIGRHESLCTSIEVIDGEPMQRIHDQVEFDIDYVEADESYIPELIDAFLRPYDLTKPPLLRTQFIKLAERKYLALFDMHHIITDGASMDVLVEEMAHLYMGGTLHELKYQYKDYVKWQDRLFASEAFQQHRAYWQEIFRGELRQLSLPTDHPRPAVMQSHGAKHLFVADRGLVAKVYEMAASTGTTLYMVLLAAYNVLLAKYSGSEDIVVGCPIIGRPQAELETMIGMFVNTVALRNYPQADMPFREFLQDVKIRCLDAFEHQDYPFEQLVQDLGLKRDPSRNPLFDTMFALQNVGVRGLNLEDIRYSTYDIQTGVTRFDLYLDTSEREGELHFALEYRTSLYEGETILRMANDYLSILHAVSHQPDLLLQDIELKSSRELAPVYEEEIEEVDFNF